MDSSSGVIPPGAFARVGDVSLPLEILRTVGNRVSSNTRVSDGGLKQVAQGLVHDELFRQGAENAIPHRARAAERGVLARGLLRAIEANVREQTTLKEADLERRWRERWTSYNRPRAVRTAELFFPVERLESDAVVRAEAEAAWSAVKGTHNVEDFVTRGRSAGALNVEAIALPPVARDGRVVPIIPQDFGIEAVELRVAEAATRLQHPGDISEVIAGDEGFHILFATEIVPELVRPLSEVRNEVEKDLLQEQVQKHLQKLKQDNPTSVQRKRDDIGALLRQVIHRT